MPPQDPQTPVNQPVVPTPPPIDGVDLSAQIPPTYAPSSPVSQPGSQEAGSALQDALYAQLTHGPDPTAPSPVVATPPASAVASDPLAGHLQAEEPDPMAGFTDPALQQAADSHMVPDAPLVPGQLAATVSPTSVDGFVSTATSQPAMATSDFANPASGPVAVEPVAVLDAPPPQDPSTLPPSTPAPAMAQAYDPTQDVGSGSTATSYPAAPEPLPMPINPLELDAIAPAPPPAAIEVGPEPAIEPTQEPVPAPPPAAAPPQIDMMTGLPISQAPQAQYDPNAPLQTMLDDSSQAALDPLDPYSDPLLMSEGSATSAVSSGKSLLFSIGIGVGVLIFGIVVLAFALGKKPVTTLSVDSLGGDTTTEETSITSTITAPDGYVAIAKSCYEFAIPTENTVSTTDANCRVDAAFGTQGVSTLAIVPLTESFESLDKAVEAAKRSAGITPTNQMAERDIALGDVAAKEIVYNAGSEAIPQSKTLIVAALSDGKYKQNGDAVTGFTIAMSSGDSFSQAAVATLEASWVWR